MLWEYDIKYGEPIWVVYLGQDERLEVQQDFECFHPIIVLQHYIEQTETFYDLESAKHYAEERYHELMQGLG